MAKRLEKVIPKTYAVHCLMMTRKPYLFGYALSKVVARSIKQKGFAIIIIVNSFTKISV